MVDITLFKNAIMLDRRTYKATASLLSFCATFEKYLKIQEMFPEKRGEMAMRLGDIATYYSSYSTQLIVYAGALKLGVLKSKNITVKHLCLLWSNLKILLLMLEAQTCPELQKTITQVNTHSKEVLKKMAFIICTKVEGELANLYR